jgi:DNA damage-binding protein 1
MFRRLYLFVAPNSKPTLFSPSIPDINIFSLAFLPSDDEYTLAILLLDLQGRLQLFARDIDFESLELSTHCSSLLQPTIISEKVVPYPTESPPQLITVPPDDDSAEVADFDDAAFLGGVLVVGGTQILLFDVASKQKQEKQKGKLKRLEAKKKSNDATEVAKAREKEKERFNRRRKPKASIDWPWSEVTAYVFGPL